jgi:phage/plasmid-associated DNA primase
MKLSLNYPSNSFLLNKTLISPSQTCEILLIHSTFRYLKIYKDVLRCYLYDPTLGIYVKISLEYLKTLTRSLLKLTGLSNLYSHEYVLRVFHNLCISEASYPYKPIFTSGYIAFTNGLLHISSRSFMDHSPNIFLDSRLTFEYDPSASCPQFHMFLHQICNGYLDRISFLRAWLNVVVRQNIYLQVFFVIVGPGASGKSTLASIATALVGKEGTITTSLRSLHNDPFETVNLDGKKLILINDSERYSGDLDILKQIVGCDSLKGRTKYVQGSSEVLTEGIVTIITNNPITSSDNSNALSRRMRSFKTENIFSSREPLIYYKDQTWCGNLSNELSGIFNYVFDMDQSEVNNIIVNQKGLNSMFQDQLELTAILNPLLNWVREQIKKGKGCYIGYIMDDKGYKSMREKISRRSIYPAYSLWCDQQGIKPVSHRRFSYDLMGVLETEGYSVKKVRKKEGMYIEGITLKEDLFDKDKLYGSPVRQSFYHESDYDPDNTGLEENIVQNYKLLLGPTEWKESFQRKSYNLITIEDQNKLIENYLKETYIRSEEYENMVKHQIQRGVEIINKQGIIPMKYKSLGISPRLIPVNYGKTINNVKKVIRDLAYEKSVSLDKERVIVDLDIKSCYTSILLGLYPDHLNRIQGIIEKEGLWNYIEKEFVSKGKEKYYNKGAVKICTYSSFFQGGNKAMMDGIMESERKKLGLTVKEFKSSTDYENLHRMSKEITSLMKDSEIVQEFQELSRRIKEENMGEKMRCPVGKEYLITEENFKSSYPNYLQGFEIALISQSTIKVKEKFETLEIMGHFHDGMVVSIKEENYEEVINEFQNEIEKVGKRMGLTYKQTFEVQKIYRGNWVK